MQMQIAMVGLGRMGGNMARRLMRAGHECVVYDRNPEAVAALVAEGAVGAASLSALAEQLRRPRAAWVMLPAGTITDETVFALASCLDADDVIVDGGNSYFKDDVRRAKTLADRGIHYLDVGTSGGVWGLERGYCLMIGGPDEAVARLDPVFATLAPGDSGIPPSPGRTPGGSAEVGYLHCGPAGAGHFVKMVHNGIEYGLMQAYAEGLSVLKHKQEFALDVHQCAEIWRYGSVIRSWLLDLTARALEADPAMRDIAPYVADSGEGRWTLAEAIDLNVPAPVIALSLIERLRSRDTDSFSDKLLAAMRHQFGGHAVKAE